MKVEIRNNEMTIKGIVNVVDRDSKQLQFVDVNNGNPFVEQVVDGTFKRAIEKNDDIKILLNHEESRCLGSTKDNLRLYENAVGLFAEFKTSDVDIIDKARNNKLVGYSFRFGNAKDSWGKTDTGIDRRYLQDFYLSEVSILDDTKIPAYDGCCILNEVRSEDGINDLYEYRCTDKEIELLDIDKQERRKLETKLKLLELELDL